MSSIDYQALLFDPIYGVLGVDSVLAREDVSETAALVVIDKTAGVVLGEDVSNQTIEPAAIVRNAELAERGVALNTLRDAVLTFNGQAWRVKSYRPKPTPKGEADGETYLILEELAEEPSESESESESAT